jgi:hypothetical protein
VEYEYINWNTLEQQATAMPSLAVFQPLLPAFQRQTRKCRK